MSIDYDKAIINKKLEDVIKTAECVRFKLLLFALLELRRIKRFEETAKKIKEDLDEI